MAKSIIVDQFGNPIEKTELSRAIAAASLTGVRNLWGHGGEAQWLTPERLAQILRAAANGDADAYLTLAEEAEERDMHYASVLGTRKRAIGGLPIVVEAASESAEHVRHAELIRSIVRLPEFLEARDDLLDGLGKGYSVVEMNWDTRQTPWVPRNRFAPNESGQWQEMEGFCWRDPRFFRFDRVTGRELRLKDESNVFDGVPLPRYRMIVHKPRIKTGIPIRSGLARLVIAGLMCKWYSLTDWLAFAEVFGMPLRVGKYGPSATPEDIQTLVSAIANIGTDAAAAIPESMKIEFESPGNTTGGADLFKNLAEWIDKQISKAVLGQTASSDGTPGQLGNQSAQDEVRQDILKSDAAQLDNSLNRDFVRAVIDLNFGPQAEYPSLSHQIIEPEDLKALVDSVKELVPMGLEVEESWMRGKLGVPEPAKGAKLLASAAAMPALPAAQNRQQSHCPACSELATAMNRIDSDKMVEFPGRLIAERLAEETDKPMEEWLATIESMAQSANDLDELYSMLMAAAGKLPLDDLAAPLTAAFTSAHAAGRYDLEQESDG
jgi:phage gp29-like protein